MTGIGNLTLIVDLLRAQKSRHVFQVPSFFKTMTIGNEYVIALG